MKATNEQFIIDFCAERGEVITNKDLIDWCIDGTETEQQLTEYAREFIDEAYQNKQENKNSWRYEVSEYDLNF